MGIILDNVSYTYQEVERPLSLSAALSDVSLTNRGWILYSNYYIQATIPGITLNGLPVPTEESVRALTHAIATSGQ